MFLSMYGASSVRTFGSTWNFCTIHGYTDPMSSPLTSKSAVPMIGLTPSLRKAWRNFTAP